jgi:hypothetical protein
MIPRAVCLAGFRSKMSFPMPASLRADICGRISRVAVSPIATMENSLSVDGAMPKPEPIYLPRDRRRPSVQDAREHLSEKGIGLKTMSVIRVVVQAPIRGQFRSIVP